MQIFHDLIHIRRDEKEETTSSGIVIPGTIDRELNRVWTGTVLGVGRGKIRDDGSYEEIPLKEGDRVMFRMSDWSLLEDKTYLIRFGSIYAII